MKKIMICLIASFAMLQSSYAATSPLIESVLEYQAIMNEIGGISNVIPVTEFIVDIKRVTKELNTKGEVRYEILTRTPSSKKRTKINRYIAILNIEPNPGLGPYIIKVMSIGLIPKS